jgi:D-alanine transaminase
MIVYLNGEFLPSGEARISPDDRGFVFGDGVYEVTRAVRGQPFAAEAHWKRLETGLRELGIRTSLDSGRILEIYLRLLSENALEDGEATIYLQVTRGRAPRAHAFPPATIQPTVYAFASRFSPPIEQRRAGVNAITYPDIRWSRCDIKTVNLLPNVLAKQKAVEMGGWEAVLVRDGVLIEGSSSNLFGVIDGELRTYPRTNYILPGITRQVVLELAAELGIPAREAPIFVGEMGRLEELFLTGTATDVQGIVTLDGYRVGDGVVGPITKALWEGLMGRLGSSIS